MEQQNKGKEAKWYKKNNLIMWKVHKRKRNFNVSVSNQMGGGSIL